MFGYSIHRDHLSTRKYLTHMSLILTADLKDSVLSEEDGGEMNEYGEIQICRNKKTVHLTLSPAYK